MLWILSTMIERQIWHCHMSRKKKYRKEAERFLAGERATDRFPFTKISYVGKSIVGSALLYLWRLY
jgi:hypothetical protein